MEPISLYHLAGEVLAGQSRRVLADAPCSLPPNRAWQFSPAPDMPTAPVLLSYTFASDVVITAAMAQQLQALQFPGYACAPAQSDPVPCHADHVSLRGSSMLSGNAAPLGGGDTRGESSLFFAASSVLLPTCVEEQNPDMLDARTPMNLDESSTAYRQSYEEALGTGVGRTQPLQRKTVAEGDETIDGIRLKVLAAARNQETRSCKPDILALQKGQLLVLQA